MRSKVRQVGGTSSSWTFHFAALGLAVALMSSTFVFCLAWIWRNLVIVLARYLRPDLGEILDPISTTMASCDEIYRRNRCNSSIFAWAVYHGDFDIGIWRRMVLEKWVEQEDSTTGLRKFGKLSCEIVFWCGYPFWREECDFRIEDHVKLVTLPKNRKWLTEREIQSYIVEEGKMEQSYEYGKSPWCMEYVPMEPLPDGTPRHFQIWRVHHALHDGFSGYRLIQEVSHTLDIDRVKAISSKPKPSFGKQLAGNLKFAVAAAMGPYQMAYSYLDSAVSFNNLRQAQLVTRKRTMAYADTPVDIQVVKDIKNKLDVSFLAVQMTAAGSVWREILKHKYPEVDLPEYLTLGMPVPTSNCDRLGNSWTFGIVRIPMGDMTTVERMKEVERDIKRLKNSGEPLAMGWAIRAIGLMPRPLLKPLYWNWWSGGGMSTLPGPEEELKLLNGCSVPRWSYFVPLLLGDGTIGMSALSAGGKMFISLVGDGGTVENYEEAQFYANRIANEILAVRKSLKGVDQICYY